MMMMMMMMNNNNRIYIAPHGCNLEALAAGRISVQWKPEWIKKF